MTSLVPAVFLGALVFAVVNWVKDLKAGDWNAAITQAVVWIIGFVVVWIAGQSRTFGAWAPLGTQLKLLGWPDLLFVGINLGSAGTTGNELLKALDNTNSGVKPMMFPGLSKHPTRPLHAKKAA